MKASKRISFQKATAVNRLHPPDLSVPGFEKLDNFYLSKSDLYPALRGDMVRFRDDIYNLSHDWAGTSSDKANWLNSVIGASAAADNIYITRQVPLSLSGSTVHYLASTYTAGTVTTNGTSTVTGVGTQWVANVWAHCFLKIGSGSWYRISAVTSDTALTVEGTITTGTGQAYTILRPHDGDRADYPVHLEEIASALVYNVASPEPITDAVCGPFVRGGSEEASAPTTFDILQNNYTPPPSCVYVVTATPTAWFSDAFTRGDGAPGNGWTEIGPETGFSISSNALSGAAHTGEHFYLYRDSPCQDYELTMTSPGPADQRNVGFVMRYSSQGFYYATMQYAAMYIYKVEGAWDGTHTKLAETPKDLGYDPWSLRVRVEGDTISFRAWKTAESEPGTWDVTATDSTFTEGGVGVKYWQWAALIDNFTLTPIQPKFYISFSDYSSPVMVTSTNGTTLVPSITNSALITPYAMVYNQTSNRWVFAAGDGVYTTAPALPPADPTHFTLTHTLSGTVASSSQCLIDDGTRFVIADGENGIRTSTDGTSWTTIAGTQTGSPTAVVYNGTDLWVSVGELTSWTSADGASWTAHAAALTFNAYGVCYDGSSLYCAVGKDGGIATSADGVTWTDRTSGTTNDLNAVIWDRTQFIAVGESGTILTSADGTTWVVQTSGTTVNLGSVASDGTTIVTVGLTWSGTGDSFDFTQAILSSTDGAAWTARTFAKPSTIQGYKKIGTDYWAPCLGALLSGTSYRNLTKAYPQQPSTVTMYDIAYSATYGHVAVGSSGAVSVKKTYWESRDIGASATLRGVVWDGTQFVIVGTGGVIYTLTILGKKTAQTSGTAQDLYGVCTSGSLLCAVGASGTILTSSDGVTWTSRTSGTTVNLNAVTHDGTRFIAVGATGTILTSTDGTTWVAKTSGTTASLSAVYADSSLIAAAGGSASVYVSTDGGTTWTASGTTSLSSHTGVYYDGTYVYAAPTSVVPPHIQGKRFIPAVVTANNLFDPISSIYRAQAFAAVDGYVVLIGTTEYSTASAAWIRYDKRVRWTAPGTIDDFTTVGSSYADLGGSGQLLDGRTVGHSVVLFETDCISVLNSTGMIDAPFEYRTIQYNLHAISNPCVGNDVVYFVGQSGLLYQTNGVSVAPLPSPFDLSKYDDFDDDAPVQLVWNSTLGCLMCYRPRSSDTEHIVYLIEPTTGSFTTITLPLGASSNYPRMLVSVLTADDPDPDTADNPAQDAT